MKSDATHRVLNGDCVEVMEALDDESIDLVLTSPPYDAIRDYKGKPPFDLPEVGVQVERLLVDGGVAVVVIQDQTKDFRKSLTSFRTAISWCDDAGLSL